MPNSIPRLITFDGEARSGKGTIVQFTKDYLRDEHHKKVMLIDAGQVFRVLVVAAGRAAIDMDDPAAIDQFLADEQQAVACVQLVKDVYHMAKSERDSLLYTNQVGVNSAKIGARPLSQDFKDSLLKKWLVDARNEGFEVVLLDGRALEEVGSRLEAEGLCDFVLGLYFRCQPEVGARRTLGLAKTVYADLGETDRRAVDELIEQIIERNQKDAQRSVQPIVPPQGAPVWYLPQPVPSFHEGRRPMLTVDTSADINKQQMSAPVASLVATRV